MTTQCLFCLEEDQFNNPVSNLDFTKYNLCSCRIQTHVSCWMEYYKHKNGFHCPICHTSVSNEQENQVVTIYVENPMQIVILNDRPILFNKRIIYYVLGAILLLVAMIAFGFYRVLDHD